MKQILIVDDETRLLQSIEAGMKSYKDKFKVLTAFNGMEAVAILEKEAIDLVVTDLRMPVMDGFELLAYMSTTHPFIPSIVMTAFATPEIETKVSGSGISKLFEKPIDFEQLAEAIIDALVQEGKEGSIAGFSLPNFLQMLAMEQKTCLLNIEGEGVQGYIFLEQGEIVAAVSGGVKGEDALFKLLSCENVRITFKKLPKKKIPKMIEKPLMSLLMEGMRRKDELELAVLEEEPNSEVPVEAYSAEVEKPPPESNTSQTTENETSGKLHVTMRQLNLGDINMGKLEDVLSKLQDIDGFMAAGIFTPNGEMAAEINTSGLKLAEIGSIANDVLLKAQKATDVMNVGRGSVVHIEAPQAHVIARCLNESESFDQSAAGKAHIHMVMMLNKDANLAMGKMKLESVIQTVAEAFR